MARSSRQARWLVGVGMLALVGALTAPPARATYPGTNGLIASGAENGSDFEITLFDPAGGAATVVTDNDAFDACPAWSPDGQQIAYCSDLGHPDLYDIFVMDADGSNVRNVTEGRVWGTFPDWSPDGQRLVFEGQVPGEEAIELYTVRVDGAQLTRLVGVGDFAFGPVWSPDGRRIAFSAGTDPEPFNLYTVAPDGSHLRQITDGQFPGGSSPDWHPHGRRIAFDADGVAGTRDLFSVRRKGWGVRQLTATADADEFLASWAPDGLSLAYNVSRADQRDIATRSVVGPVVGPEQLVTDDFAFELAPSWQPLP